MKAIVGTVVAVLLVQLFGAIVFIYSGMFNVAANEPHWSVTHAILETVRVRSIKLQAAAIKPPDNLAEHRMVVAGTAHFAEHCSSCHTAPGVEASELAKGMYPKPPVLTTSAKQWSPGELFWIIRHGIKMSGMPAWPDHSDEDIWNIIAFLGKLPNMTEQDYGGLVKESMEAGGHATHGGTGAGAECAPQHRAAGHC
jgi:mono/diheme cytochrome c family protein